MTTKQAAGVAKGGMEPSGPVPTLAAELQAIQRQRSVVLKSRNMQANRLRAVIAGTLGYAANMAEKDRKAMFKQADAVIKAVEAGDESHPFRHIILTTLKGIDAFDDLKNRLEKVMVKIAKRLPVAAWVQAPEQRGFGLLFLAIVIGETGDLSNYANPAKVWRRLGCAPWTFDGKTRMGSTWRAGKEGRLPGPEWEAYGYCPRRRSIAYLIGEGIVKQNTMTVGDGEAGRETDGTIAGPYRQRYDQAKAKLQAAHPEYPAKRCHLHGMLLSAKLLLKELWCEWNGRPPLATPAQ